MHFRITRLKFFFFILLISLLFSCYKSNSEDKKAESDHYNGKIFYNPFPDYQLKGFSDFLSWQMKKGNPKWEKRLIVQRTSLPSKKYAGSITFINHSTTAIQLDGKVILTDPIWDERASPVGFAGPKRYHEPAITMKNLGWVDVVVISHNHYDHMSLETLKALEDLYSPLFIAPLGNQARLEEAGLVHIKTLDWWETINFEKIEITLTPAQHWSKRTLTDTNASLWGSYYIASKKHRVYFAGDTGYGPHFTQIYKKFGGVDLALLPIGAYKPEWFMKDNHMGPKDVVQVKTDLHAKKVMSIHFGTFALGDDGQDEPKNELLESIKGRKDIQDYVVPTVGQSMIL